MFTGLHLRQGQIPAIHVFNYVTLEVHAILDTVCVIMCVCMCNMPLKRIRASTNRPSVLQAYFAFCIWVQPEKAEQKEKHAVMRRSL